MKNETRSPKSEGNPKFRKQNKRLLHRRAGFGFRRSDLLRASSFGSSDFIL
jgi:hypothetical protein